MSQAQTVFVVDDDNDFRESLTWLLEGGGHHVQGFDNAESFLQHYEQVAGDQLFGCLLLDVRMAGMSGLVLQQELNSRDSVLPVIMITGHGDVSIAVQAMKNHAVDFIEKPFSDTLLLKLVAETLGRSQLAFAKAEKFRLVKQCWQALSKREKKVAELVINGFINREIADTLGISIKTVEIHRSRVMTKMQAKHITDLLALKPYLDIAE